MPMYTYKCQNCGHEFEQRQRMTEAPLTDCPVCEGSVRRVVNSVGVVFKGSGFYVTDTRNGNSATNGKSGSTGKKESSTTSSNDDSAATTTSEPAATKTAESAPSPPPAS